MKLYKRMIRPMVELCYGQGFCSDLSPLEDNNKWYPEDFESPAQLEKWKNEAKKAGSGWGILRIQKKLFEVSPQELKEILKNQANAE